MPASEAPAGAVFANHAPPRSVAPSIVRDIPLALLQEPLDPMRHNMDDEAMLDLIRSIRESGLFQNLCVVPVEQNEKMEWVRTYPSDLDEHIRAGGFFRVAAGHRRLLACREARHDPVRCGVFMDPAVSEDTIMAGENTVREEPSDYDLAVLYAKWLKEPGMTERELSRRAGKTVDFIYKRAEILEGYEQVAIALHERKISFQVARAINRCDEPEWMQHFLNMAIDQGASPKLVNAWVSERKALKDMTPAAGPQPAQPLRVTAPTFQKIECLLCGDTQSYNLQTVMLCGADIERIKAARAAAEAAEAAPQE